jgi:hypothetical protein
MLGRNFALPERSHPDMGLSTRALRGLGATACAATLAGCYTLTYNIDEVYGPPTPRPQVIRSFKVEVKHHHVLFGLITPGNPDEVQEAIAREVKLAGGRGAANVRVTHQATLIDGAIRWSTMVVGFPNRLYEPTTTVVEGDVVR